MILTATRPNEVRFARWDEVDSAADVWSIPAHRMKSKRPHRVPLSIQASVLLGEVRYSLDCTTGLVFPAPSGKPLSENALCMRTRKTGVGTAHGFRSAFRSWAAERGASWELAEMSLSHCVGSATERAYMRSDLLEARRDLMQAWANHCGPELPF